jgi:hypothetical protein
LCIFPPIDAARAPLVIHKSATVFIESSLTMIFQRCAKNSRARFLISAFVLSAWLLGDSAAWGQYGGGRGGGRHGSSSKSDSSDSHSSYAPLPAPAALMPHGGDYVSTEKNYYEIVYMPFQTRIYVYDKKFKPLSASELQAQITLQIPLEPAARKVSLQYVPMPAGATEQDFVAASIDIRPLQDKETSVTLDLTKRSDPTATFTPHYDHFAIRPYVSQAALMESDHDAVNRQRICPVTGAVLGSRGPIVKLYVTDIPLYVSGEDCIAAVRDDPRKFVPQAPPVPDRDR